MSDTGIDIAGVAAAKRALAGYSPALRAALAPRLLDAGRTIAGDIQDAVRAMPVRGVDRGVRQALAESIRVRSYGRPPAVGVLIESTGQQLPDSKQPLVKAWNLSSYRHPVFGHGDRRWVTQPGARYFAGSYVTRRQGLLVAAVEDAAQTAADAAERTAR